ncbi:NAD(P)H dehydrogenase (quinone) [Novosphingobium chloroacetimidivorans]|uniref:NAD(P)H dehydrogenase (Quinone) n=1 Tax=Novosphingobium chloroacetimidivorans TaxID=1428314 RepID=A0A7W7NWZ9_9SPHN|nr:SDR family oxidoreductase [Novosphingobium chloroacetimidivorans]MBB4858665.1 NAD(P)H dehydrogenase (quinone) [Novosphingobium chloroacetimidivorans]
MPDNNTYLVTGASGALGRLVVEGLLRGGATRVIATSRNPASLADLAARGVVTREADFNRPETLEPAFAGATHLLIISTHEVGSRADGHLRAVAAAKAAGVRHLFYTSHAACDTSTSPVAPEHVVTERAILSSGMTYTILRNFLYAENLLMVLGNALEEGRFYGTAGESRVSWLTRRDCADAASGAMLHADAHANRVYDVTGPRAYTYAEVAALLSQVEGRPIVYEDLSEDGYVDLLVGRGLPRPAAEVLLGLELSLRSGEMEPVNDMVRTLTGREPETLESFFRHGRGAAVAPESLDFLQHEMHDRA